MSTKTTKHKLVLVTVKTLNKTSGFSLASINEINHNQFSLVASNKINETSLVTVTKTKTIKL